MASKLIDPFFEPGAPPPTIPQLTKQTLISYAHTNTTILAGEELPRQVMVGPQMSARRHITLHPCIGRKRDNDSVGSENEISDLDSESDDSSDGEKIPKPPGEAGRPGRGGYNLQVKLGWHPKDYVKVRVSHLSLPANNF
jgi:hypothetical protein